MSANRREEVVTSLFTTWDLSVEQDLFEWWFAQDPLAFYITPSFETIEELNGWMFKNHNSIRKELEGAYG